MILNFRADYSTEKAKEKEDRKQKRSEQKAKKNDTVSKKTIILCIMKYLILNLL